MVSHWEPPGAGHPGGRRSAGGGVRYDYDLRIKKVTSATWIPRVPATPFSGGEGTIAGTFGGALIMTVLQAVLTALNTGDSAKLIA